MPKEKQIIHKARKGKPIRQVAAIPIRRDAEGRIEVMLVTSNTTKRFIVPKGWPMKGKSGRKAATIEAREEAGVVGVALKKPLGTYAYWKRLSNRFVKVVVTVYLLPVAEELPQWQESATAQARLADAGGCGKADRRAGAGHAGRGSRDR